MCVHLELGFKFIQFCHWIGFTHLLGDKSEIAYISLSVSTCQDLQNGIVDEHILFLYSSEIAQHFVSCRVRNNRPLRNRLVYNWCVVAQWEVLTEHYVFFTHEALDHLHSLCSEVDDDTSYIHHLLLLQLVQNTVNGYQSTSPTNTSTVWT